MLLVQGGYYAAAGAVPFLSRRLFEAATGPKQDWWLVQTVGGLVTVIGAGLVRASLPPRRPDEPVPAETVLTAGGSAALLAGIDVVYVAKQRIPPAYLLDAVAEVGIIIGLAASLRARRRG